MTEPEPDTLTCLIRAIDLLTRALDSGGYLTARHRRGITEALAKAAEAAGVGLGDDA